MLWSCWDNPTSVFINVNQLIWIAWPWATSNISHHSMELRCAELYVFLFDVPPSSFACFSNKCNAETSQKARYFNVPHKITCGWLSSTANPLLYRSCCGITKEHAIVRQGSVYTVIQAPQWLVPSFETALAVNILHLLLVCNSFRI